MKKLQFKRQTGMTLIELIIVVIVIGILAVVGARSFSNSGVTDNAKAAALYEATTKLSNNFVMLAQFAGVSSDYSSNTLFVTGSSNLDVLVQGPTKLKPEYQSAWAQAGITALTDVAQGGPLATSYKIQGFTVTAAGGGANPHTYQFSLPEAVANALIVKYGSGTVPAATVADQAAPVIRYAALVNGMRTVTIVRQL